jgi:hypothetical protein
LSNCSAIKILSVILVLLLAITAKPINKVQAEADYFTIKVLPVTQHYSQNYTAILNQQAQWIVDNSGTQNIIIVVTHGYIDDG